MARHVLRAALAAGSAITLAALAGCSSPAPVSRTEPSLYASQTRAGARLDKQAAASMISELRRGNGLAAVRLDADLNRMAEQQASAMARADKLSHSVDGTFKDRIARSGIRNGGMVENIGAGHDTLADAFTGWRSSPPHLKNMLMPKAGAMGIAAVRAPGSRYEVFWAMVMSDPNDPRPIVTGAVTPAPSAAEKPKLGETTLTINGMSPGR